jgi:hypothetical protein
LSRADWILKQRPTKLEAGVSEMEADLLVAEASILGTTAKLLKMNAELSKMNEKISYLYTSFRIPVDCTIMLRCMIKYGSMESPSSPWKPGNTGPRVEIMGGITTKLRQSKASRMVGMKARYRRLGLDYLADIGFLSSRVSDFNSKDLILQLMIHLVRLGQPNGDLEFSPFNRRECCPDNQRAERRFPPADPYPRVFVPLWVYSG